ncbi:hypothetical protein ACFQ69_36960 [Streptomyces sp. NPDC056470]|uniref:hypothetical protein n=1 Tax=Streptomyces sp. NPDC056470 TaxID=3345831 RepID=UPI0036AB662C
MVQIMGVKSNRKLRPSVIASAAITGLAAASTLAFGVSASAATEASEWSLYKSEFAYVATSHWGMDLDEMVQTWEGNSGPIPGQDIYYQAYGEGLDSTYPGVVPAATGVKIAWIGNSTNPVSDCSAATSTGEYVAAVLFSEMTEGGYMCARTDTGRLSTVRIMNKYTGDMPRFDAVARTYNQVSFAPPVECDPVLPECFLSS